ncbi:hypothetical protein Trydic_g16743 [Trypoxylus dichotomus]
MNTQIFVYILDSSFSFGPATFGVGSKSFRRLDPCLNFPLRGRLFVERFTGRDERTDKAILCFPEERVKCERIAAGRKSVVYYKPTGKVLNYNRRTQLYLISKFCFSDGIRGRSEGNELEKREVRRV